MRVQFHINEHKYKLVWSRDSVPLGNQKTKLFFHQMLLLMFKNPIEALSSHLTHFQQFLDLANVQISSFGDMLMKRRIF